MLINRQAKIALRVIGGLGILVGLIMLGQGTGIIRIPADGAMVGSMIWAYRGFCVAAMGGILLAVSRIKS